MKESKSLRTNVMMNTILTVANFLFPLITFSYVSRVLLPAGTGKISFVTSVVSYFVMFAQLGVPTYGIRACAKVRDDKVKLTKVVHEITFINFITMILAYTILFIVIFKVERFSNEKNIFIIMSFQIGLNVLGMEWLYKALEQYSYITIRSIIFKFIAVIATFLLIHNQKDYVLYAGITIFATSASNILNFLNLKKHIYLKKCTNYNFSRHLKPIIIFFLMSCATTIYTNLDNVMLGIIKDEIEVGYYNAAVKIRNILVSVITSLGVVLLPRASYYFEHKLVEEFYRINYKALKFVSLIAIPLQTFFIIFAKEGIFFLAGEAYEKSIAPMQIIMITLMFIGMTNIMGIQMLVPMGKETFVFISEIIGAIVDVIINLILIPTYGAMGAAIGTVLAEISVWLIQLIILKEKIITGYSEINYWGIVCSTVVGIVGVYWIKFLDIDYLLKLISGGILYFTLYGGSMIYIFKEQLLNEFVFRAIKRIRDITRENY